MFFIIKIKSSFENKIYIFSKTQKIQFGIVLISKILFSFVSKDMSCLQNLKINYKKLQI